MKPVKITDRNIMFTQPMNDHYDLNIGLILGNKHNFIIDTGLGSGSVKPIIEYIGSDKKPIIVVNTHCHWDHIWGNFMFENSLIIGHPLCRELQDKHWDDVVKDYKESIDGEVRKCLVNTWKTRSWIRSGFSWRTSTEIKGKSSLCNSKRCV